MIYQFEHEEMLYIECPEVDAKYVLHALIRETEDALSWVEDKK